MNSSTGRDTRYISIRGWRQFQHYDPRKRTPPWIKNYTELLHDDAYLNLNAGCRAVLHGLWLEYASSHCRVPVDTKSLTRRLSLKVLKRQLETLNGAGFIDFVASAALAEGYHDASAEVEIETETEKENDDVGEKQETPGDDFGAALREFGLTPSQAALALREDHDRVRRVIEYASSGDNPAALAWMMIRDKHEPSQNGNSHSRYTGCRYVRGTHAASHVHDPLGTDKPPASWPYPKPTANEIRVALEAA